MMSSVAVAMSGGVDSSAAAAILLEQGFDVVGVSLHLWQQGQGVAEKSESVEQARQVAEQLGIPFAVMDAREYFHEHVVQSFVQSYLEGVTPSPCVGCNRAVKWESMLSYAASQKIDYVATGHYARLEQDDSGAVHLLRGHDEGKDQAYMLAFLGQRELLRTLLPIGGYTKSEIRAIARRFGLEAAERSESQDLCFLPDGDYRQFIRENAADKIRPGEIVSLSGDVLGEHQGLPFYTIGQRKGLGISTVQPVYVVKKDIAANQLVVAEKAALGKTGFVAGRVNWIQGSPPREVLRAQVKIRYRSPLVWGQLQVLESGQVHVRLEAAQADITPGQVAVFYQDDEVLGGGIIQLAGRN
ncbi:MAG: tRNA 2-thiouridine(34) synthase MnmA [Anaerolineaceae bacterium]|jgi:tRNA-specific 2-thiouridylase|nr:tRNA 2-thiouridine(34) synthase MnmA [Anaerolineaceae bacterium]